MKPLTKTYLFLALSAVLLLSACASGVGQNNSKNESKMAPLDEMPNEVRTAPAQVQQAYQFAAANPEIMTQIPCYCGCGEMGHISNYACYIGGKNADGSLIYDTHALGCSICVDITLDTMRLLKEGKSVPEIRAYVDQTYAQYGPSNMP